MPGTDMTRTACSAVVALMVAARLFAVGSGGEAPQSRSGMRSEVLTAVSTASASDAWAVGYLNWHDDRELGVIVHWDGVSWSTQLRQAPAGGEGQEYFAGVSADSTSDVWAVGATTNSAGVHPTAITEHRDGSTWSPVPVHTPRAVWSELSSVSSIAPDNAWAVGSYDPTGRRASLPMVLHWDGADWRPVHIPHAPVPRFTVLTSISACGPANIWAAGYGASTVQRRSNAYVVHWEPVDEAVAVSYGRLAVAVAAAGRQPRRRVMDLLIAATAHAHGARLYTRNIEDFAGLDELIDVVPV